VREHWYDGEEADGDGDRIRVGDGRGFMVEICDCDNLLVVPLVGENGYGRKGNEALIAICWTKIIIIIIIIILKNNNDYN
jgi:hypothetical protein